LSPASSGEGSAVSAFPSDKVCEVVEKMKLMQADEVDTHYGILSSFLLLFEKKKER
jgi:hypothetical protein